MLATVKQLGMNPQKVIGLAIVLAFTSPASAILIEDSAVRLVFEVWWAGDIHAGGPGSGGTVGTGDGGLLSGNGSTAFARNNFSRNLDSSYIEVEWVVGGVPYSHLSVAVDFGTDPDNWVRNVPSWYGTPNLRIGGGVAHYAMPGEIYGAVIVIGQDYPNGVPPWLQAVSVPDISSTLPLLAGAMASLFCVKRRVR